MHGTVQCTTLTFYDLIHVCAVCSGDPTMYQAFWRRRANGERATIVIPGSQTMSYFSDVSGMCWFLEPEFEREVRRLHRLVGNAVVDGYHLLVGTGSTQLFQAVLYALSPAADGKPMSVVSPAPYYSVRNSNRSILQLTCMVCVVPPRFILIVNFYIQSICTTLIRLVIKGVVGNV
jgi:hypothetical protein